MDKPSKIFAVKVCPVCENWQIQGGDMITKQELEQIYLEHLYECFGIPVELMVKKYVA